MKDQNWYKINKEKVINYSNSYYTGQPEVTDQEYDKLYKEVEQYEIDNNIIENKISSIIQIPKKNDKEEHLTKMYSIKDCFDPSDLSKFIDSYFGEEFVVDYKYDGASLNLIYKDGKLVKGLTRGDGTVGENITHNLEYIENIPKTIVYSEEIEIRGEVIIENHDFFTKVKDLYPELTNPRNTVSGTMRMLDPEHVKNRCLKFQPYGTGYNYKYFKTHKETMDFIYSLGFKNLYSNLLISKNLEEIKNYLNKTYLEIKENRFKVNLDGAVIRVNNLELNKEFNLKYPKFMLAYKFPYIEQKSTLINIIPQVGRTGVITPVGVIEPTNIDGVTVSSVTLHNYEEIKRKDLRLYDKIGVIRSGEVIPKLTNVFYNERTGNEKIIEPPTHCPKCNQPIVKDGLFIRCVNDDCSGRTVKNLLNFVSRDNMNIIGMGEKLIEELVEKNVVKKPSDIYDLTAGSFINIDNMKAKSIENVLTSIEKSKYTTFDKVISGFGIPDIGTGAAKLIAKESNNLVDILKKDIVDLEELENELKIMGGKLSIIKGLGNKAIESFISYVKRNNGEMKKTIKHIKLITIKNESDKLKDKIFCITGDVSIGRKALTDKLVKNGATVISTVNKDTILIANDKSDSSKYQTALKLNCKIITEKELEEYLK